VRKAALLEPGAAPGDALYLEEDMRPASATDAERQVADEALRALTSNNLLQARVDLLPTDDGPVVLEVELTEPSLYLGFAAGATERFASAIAAAVAAR
jgi:glutathione synthase/RimK-type ligase-like ATP-grasp enzyme